MPFCTQCSTELDESWNACPNCGNIRPDRTESGSVSSPSVHNSSTEPLGSLFGDSKQSTETAKKSSQSCANCGALFTEDSGFLKALLWFARKTDASAAAAQKEAKKCRCGLPIHADPEYLKNSGRLFWISRIKFDPNLWSDIERRGLMPKRYHEFAIRIINEKQAIDAIIQIKIVGKKIYVQQHGEDIVSQHTPGYEIAKFEITNDHGVRAEYWLTWRPREFEISIQYIRPTGNPETRWIRMRQ